MLGLIEALVLASMIEPANTQYLSYVGGRQPGTSVSLRQVEDGSPVTPCDRALFL